MTVEDFEAYWGLGLSIRLGVYDLGVQAWDDGYFQTWG